MAMSRNVAYAMAMRQPELWRGRFASPDEFVNAMVMGGGAGAPEDVVVTPSTPAPVAEGAPIAAPKQTIDIGNVLATARNAQNPEAPKTFAQMREAELAATQAARKAAGVLSPEEAQIFKNREERYKTEEADIEKDRKDAVWDAIMMAGLKMAQSQSPYFAAALAQGMEAGLTGYNESKAERAKRKALLQDRKESSALDQIKLVREAGDRAVQERRDAAQSALADLQGENARLEQQFNAETMPDRKQLLKQQIEANDLQMENIRKGWAFEERKLGLMGQELGIKKAAAEAAGRGGGMSAKTAATYRNSFVNEKKAAQKILSDPLAPREAKRAAGLKIEDINRKLNKLDSMTFGADEEDAGVDFVWSPKSGLVGR